MSDQIITGEDGEHATHTFLKLKDTYDELRLNYNVSQDSINNKSENWYFVQR